MLYDRSYMRETPYQTRWSLTLILIVINVAVYAVGLVADLAWPGPYRTALRYLALVPADFAQGWIWQLVTFQFLHGSLLHLLINCAVLYMFGRGLEETLGRAVFMRLYLGSGAFGGCVQFLCAWAFPAHFGMLPLVGASAGVFGLVAAFAVLNRETPITTLLALIIPITMKAKYLLAVEAGVAVLGMLGPPSTIAHAAHLGGIIGAILYLQIRYVAAMSRLRWPRLRTVPARRELVGAAAPKRIPGRGRQGSSTVDEPTSPDFISREVDPILEKISAHGIHSLTERERKILELARARMNQG